MTVSALAPALGSQAWIDSTSSSTPIGWPGTRRALPTSSLLESLGVLAQADAGAADEALLARRREQLEALAALQVYVEREISAL